MSGSRRLLHGCIAALCVGAITPLHAQSARALPLLASQQGGTNRAQGTQDSPARASLEKIVSLDLRGVRLETALEEIARQAQVELQYTARVVPVDRKVTVRRDSITARAALELVLEGTGVVVRVPAAGRVALVKEERRSEDGVVTGRITDVASGQPLKDVVINVKGTTVSTLTNERGVYRLPAVPAGKQVIVARLLGYVQQERTVTVVDGQEVQADFALELGMTRLQQMVTTATGDQRLLELGNSVATINADSVVKNVPIRNLSDLLTNRAPGLYVLPSSGIVGAPSRLRIRGLTSVNAANDPIIIVDGVRINAEHLAGRDPNLPGVNNRPSRIDDIDPTIIESIEVLNGPSASSLYGSDAANGIIVIKTKRGRPGPARWSFNGEHIESRMAISLPPTSYGYGHGLMGDGWRGCTLWDQASGNCAVLDSVKTFNVFSNKSTTPFGTGHFTRVGGNVSGGSEAVQYFVSGSYIDDLGLTRLPKHNEEVISRAHGGAAVPGYLRRPNTQNEAHVMGNVVARLNEQLDVRLVSQFTRLNNRRGNDGVGQSAFMTLFDPSDSTALVGGWEQFFVERSDQVTRSSNTVSATWQPRSWLMGRGAYGYDYSVTNDTELNRRDSCMPRCGWSQGYPDSVGSIRFGNRTSVVQNVDLRATATWPLLNELTMRTSTGMQYVRSTMRDLNGWAFDLPRGRTSVAGASGQKQIDEVSDDVATAGWYLEQSAAFREKLFATAGFRRDAGSAFGDRVSPIYPKWSLSYLASSEPFFAPIRPWIGTLRLRGAYGHAGIQPPTTNRLRLYGQFGRFVRPDGTLESYTYMSSIGNGELRPERSVELEWGFDVDAFDGRVRAELTSFRKTTRDAVVNRPLAPSLGYSTRRENVGTVRNTGLEAVVSGTILRDGFATWDVSVGYASRQNKLIELGPNVAPFSVANGWGYNDYGRVVEGYPLFGRWMKPVVGYHDANGDGIIGFEEVRMGDSLVYMGASEPKYQMSMNHNIGLFRNRVRLTASFQFVGDFVQVNSFLQQISWRIPSAYDRNLGTPQQQAYMHMGFWGAQYGFVERTNTLRLNSLGIQMTLPDAITRSLRATRADLTLMGSNLGVWTSYKGADPALNSAGALGNRVVDDGGLAMPRSLGIRVNLSY